MRGCRIVAGCGLLLTLCLLVVCDSPGTGPSAPQEYVFYVSRQNQGMSGTYYRYNTQSGTLDTLVGAGGRSRIAAGLDGHTMFLGGASSAVTDDSMRLLEMLPFNGEGGTAVSPDGHLLALTGLGVTIVRAADYSTVWQDTSLQMAFQGAFSRDSKTFYCGLGGPDSNGVIIVTGLPSAPSYHIKRYANRVLNVIPSPDEQHWYLYCWVSVDVSRVLVYDVGADSIIRTISVSPGPGDMALTQDGDLLFFSNYGSPSALSPAPSYFYCYDTQRDIIDTISPIGFVNSGGEMIGRMVVKFLAVSDNDRYVVATGYGHAQIAVYDIRGERFRQCYQLDAGTEIGDVACKRSESVGGSR